MDGFVDNLRDEERSTNALISGEGRWIRSRQNLTRRFLPKSFPRSILLCLIEDVVDKRTEFVVVLL
jgi:hypothetical protein